MSIAKNWDGSTTCSQTTDCFSSSIPRCGHGRQRMLLKTRSLQQVCFLSKQSRGAFCRATRGGNEEINFNYAVRYPQICLCVYTNSHSPWPRRSMVSSSVSSNAGTDIHHNMSILRSWEKSDVAKLLCQLDYFRIDISDEDDSELTPLVLRCALALRPLQQRLENGTTWNCWGVSWTEIAGLC